MDDHGAADSAEYKAIETTITTLDETVRLLRAVVSGDAPQSPLEPARVARPRDGRYEGGNGELFVDLRVDIAGAGVLSADVHATGRAGRSYLASVRTAPGTRVDGSDRRWPAAWQDAVGATTTGTIGIRTSADDPNSVTAVFTVDRRLNGLPPRTDIVVVASHAGDELRPLGLEVETEKGVQLPGAVSVGGVEHSFTSCLRAAGFAVRDAGLPTEIPAEPGGWNLSVSFTVLHDLMTGAAQAPLTAAAWELHALMLGKSTREGLLGVMFDSGDVLPRQGAAIFVNEIRERVPAAEHNRKIIQTTVHELGHALNLAHRFERVVGRADSTSFMNYDWRYLGGNQREEFWRRFAFTFDPDELEFMRHAPRPALIPGGADFHTVNYWADGTGGYSPYVPEVPLPGFALTLKPPATGTLFAFGQPVFLEVTLENQTTRPINLPPEVLDPKAGFLELLVQRRTGGRSTGLADAVPFIPIMQRCFDIDVRTAETLGSGATLRNNLNLTFGSGGFAFAEPGEYDITPLLSFFVDNEDLVIRGQALRIRVAHPHDMGEERDAQTLFRPDVGAWFALGGTDSLASAGEALEEVRERRTAEFGDADPVVAAIVRAAAISAARPSVRFVDGRFVKASGDPDRAAKLLTRLDDAALRNFDPHTAEHTRKLVESYGAQ